MTSVVRGRETATARREDSQRARGGCTEVLGDEPLRHARPRASFAGVMPHGDMRRRLAERESAQTHARRNAWEAPRFHDGGRTKTQSSGRYGRDCSPISYCTTSSFFPDGTRRSLASRESCAPPFGWISTSLKPCGSMGRHHLRTDHNRTISSSAWQGSERPSPNPVGWHPP